ncbi:MAG: DUF429 domain-containing protein [Candidatus Omnitrophica bacterium]|nr:DUF429 domain-containing protein [Candidatus Omnitrophota bacterium]
MPGRAASPCVAGIDGARGGWCLVLKDLDTGEISGRVLRTFDEALDLPQNPRIVAVDMPIGLLNRAEPGGRLCDREARKFLGRPRQTSVFSPPVRPALEAASYRAALKLNRASSPSAIGISIHCYGLFRKLREIDRRMTPALQRRFREAHPEICFSLLNGAPVTAPKRTGAGRNIRQNLLTRAGYRSVRWAGGFGPSQASTDDVLDAQALCWMAEQIYYERVRPLSEGPAPRDERGLKMEIWGNRCL